MTYKETAKSLNLKCRIWKWGIKFGRHIDPSGKKYGWKPIQIIPLWGWSFDPHEIIESLANDPAFSISYKTAPKDTARQEEERE